MGGSKKKKKSENNNVLEGELGIPFFLATTRGNIIPRREGSS